MADRTHSVLFGEYYAMICFGGKPNPVFAHRGCRESDELTGYRPSRGQNRSENFHFLAIDVVKLD